MDILLILASLIWMTNREVKEIKPAPVEIVWTMNDVIDMINELLKD